MGEAVTVGPRCADALPETILEYPDLPAEFSAATRYQYVTPLVSPPLA